VINIHKLDDFTESYIETALWSTTDNSDESGGRPLDDNYDVSDIGQETLEKIVADCKAFQGANWNDIKGNPKRAGHDFWLTRNHHGAGFWDGDWPKAVGKRLTEDSHAYGSFDLYVGSDNLIHGS
jgi:hypothetical protein